MASLTRATAASFAAMGLLLIGSGAVAQTATQADFDACNRTAQAASAGSTAIGGSASLGSGSPAGSMGTGGSSSVSPGSADANRQPNSSGRLSPSAGSPGTNSGTVGNSAGAPSASPRMAAADPQLAGMGAEGHGSAAYQQAYRDCMKQRGF